jgi:hypothetical protein
MNSNLWYEVREVAIALNGVVERSRFGLKSPRAIADASLRKQRLNDTV